MKNKQALLVADIFEGILKNVLACLPQSQAQQKSMAIAYSGGLDSLALLRLAEGYATRHGIKLFAFHIHHGLSPNADNWLMHCQNTCARLGVTFDVEKIILVKQSKIGIEEAARNGRYAALGALCRRHDVPLLLTAHHQDDQAETVLLQLLRGSGVAGLSGMEMANTAPNLLKHDTLLMARPLLAVSRAQLERLIASQEIVHIEDESNVDPRFARNALRHQVMPSLESHFPGFQERFARTAQHAQSAQRLLIELAAQDLQRVQEGDCLDLSQLKKMSLDRIYNLLRYWFGLRGLRMPSSAWLVEACAQLFEAKFDAQLCVTHPDCHLRRYRDKIFITPRQVEAALNAPPVFFRWDGTSQMYFEKHGGTLHFDHAEEGMDADWLRTQDLKMCYRQGGERLKLASNRPTKNLKYHCQELGIPPWEREYLPLVYSANRLLFAANIGQDAHHQSSEAGVRIRLRWQADVI